MQVWLLAWFTKVFYLVNSLQNDASLNSLAQRSHCPTDLPVRKHSLFSFGSLLPVRQPMITLNNSSSSSAHVSSQVPGSCTPLGRLHIVCSWHLSSEVMLSHPFIIFVASLNFFPLIHFTVKPLMIKEIHINNTSTCNRKNISIAKWKRQVKPHCLKEGVFWVSDSCAWTKETNRKAKSAKSSHFWIISFSSLLSVYHLARRSHSFQNRKLFFWHTYTCYNWDKYIWDFCRWRREHFSQLFKEGQSSD